MLTKTTFLATGCDHKKYHQRRQKMEGEHKKRMSKVIREWENAEKRYNILKNEDFKQAEQMLSGQYLKHPLELHKHFTRLAS